jgi:phosphoribosylamine-glycine ligase
VFHAGTKIQDKEVITNGGRVLTVVGTGSTLQSAVDKAYEAVSKIHFEGMFTRTDIAHKSVCFSNSSFKMIEPHVDVEHSNLRKHIDGTKP